MRFINKQHISANKIGVAYDNVCHIVKPFHQPQTSANINLYETTSQSVNTPNTI